MPQGLPQTSPRRQAETASGPEGIAIVAEDIQLTMLMLAGVRSRFERWLDLDRRSSRTALSARVGGNGSRGSRAVCNRQNQ